LGDATTDKITTRGDLYVEDDAVFSDTIRVTGDAYFAGDVGIGTATPSVSLDIVGTDAVKLPAGTDAQRPSAAEGLIRLNTDSDRFEGYNDGNWHALGQGTGNLTSDTFTANGVLSGFALTATPNTDKDVLVSVGGIVQTPTTNYVVASSTLNFTSIPPSGVEIEARHLNVGFIHYDDETIPGDKTFPDDITILGNLSVSGDFTLGDATTDKITTRGDLHVEDDAFFSDQVQVETDQIIKGGAVRDGSWHRGLEITTENANYASLFFGNQQTTKYSAIVWASSTSGNTGNKRGAQLYAQPTSTANTDLRFDTNNAVGTSNPTLKMLIRGDGKVGIGTDAPSEKLHAVGNVKVEQTTNTNVEVKLNPYSSALGTSYAWNLVAGNSTNSYGFDIKEATTSIFHINNSAGGNNNVGIGTTAPAYNLQVKGAGSQSISVSSTSTHAAVRIDRFNTSQDANLIFTTAGTNKWRLATGLAGNDEKLSIYDDIADTNMMTFVSGTGVGIGTVTPGTNLHIEGNTSGTHTTLKLKNLNTTAGIGSQIQFHDHDSYFYQTIVDGDIRFYNGAEIMILKADGKVGIGTTAPQNELHVYGSTWGEIRLEGASGAELMLFHGGTRYGELFASSAGLYLKANANVSLNLVDDSGNGIVVKDGGNVGINHDNPREKLDVISTIRVSRDTSDNEYLNIGPATDAGLPIKWVEDTTDASNGYGKISFETNASPNATYPSRGGFSFGKTGGSPFMLIANTGKVGIGTTTPQQLLDIEGAADNADLTGLILYNNDWATGETGQSVSIQFTLNRNGTQKQAGKILVGKDDDFDDGGSADSNMQFYTTLSNTVTERMRIKSDGNVGIGTATPSAKLEVNGSFAATTKSFLIDHPTKPGKKLRHGSLEGPENGVYIRGKSDSNIIELPEYWTKLIDEDSITVQLTPIGKHQHIYVEKIDNNTVYIQSDEARKNVNDLNYYYLILAERIDVEKLQIEE
jgi:hypothetical protein